MTTVFVIAVFLVETGGVSARSEEFGDVLDEIAGIERRFVERDLARFHARIVEYVVQEIEQARA